MHQISTCWIDETPDSCPCHTLQHRSCSWQSGRGTWNNFFSDKEEGAQNHLHKVHFHNIMTIWLVSAKHSHPPLDFPIPPEFGGARIQCEILDTLEEWTTKLGLIVIPRFRSYSSWQPTKQSSTNKQIKTNKKSKCKSSHSSWQRGSGTIGTETTISWSGVCPPENTSCIHAKSYILKMSQ